MNACSTYGYHYVSLACAFVMLMPIASRYNMELQGSTLNVTDALPKLLTCGDATTGGVVTEGSDNLYDIFNLKQMLNLTGMLQSMMASLPLVRLSVPCFCIIGRCQLSHNCHFYLGFILSCSASHGSLQY